MLFFMYGAVREARRTGPHGRWAMADGLGANTASQDRPSFAFERLCRLFDDMKLVSSEDLCGTWLGKSGGAEETRECKRT